MSTFVPVDLALWDNSGGTLVPPNESAIQVQCPNCGGYRSNRAQLTQPLNPPLTRPVATGWLLVAWWCFLATGLGFCGLVLISAQARSVLFRGKWHVAQQLIGYTCTCELCGRDFTWKFADPHPLVKTQDDLVRLGAAKLRQEEEERRRLDDDR